MYRLCENRHSGIAKVVFVLDDANGYDVRMKCLCGSW